MVDLPGITKVPVRGQSLDIEEMIQDLILQFIEQDNALILAISSANQDLANSDALKIARQVDPKGKRTIGVLTKVDLMDEGTDACELLTGSIYPLKHGYYGVKMRSQLDIKNHVTIRQAKINEVKYFKNHNSYKNNMS
jgi:replication fork clamp-binding protein CrfC